MSVRGCQLGIAMWLAVGEEYIPFLLVFFSLLYMGDVKVFILWRYRGS